MNSEHRLDWQLDDILQVPYEGQIKNPNIFGLFICPYKNCGKQFPEKLLFQDHLELFHDFQHTFSIYVDFSNEQVQFNCSRKMKKNSFSMRANTIQLFDWVDPYIFQLKRSYKNIRHCILRTKKSSIWKKCLFSGHAFQAFTSCALHRL